MQDRKRDTDVQNRIWDSVGEGESGTTYGETISDKPGRTAEKHSTIDNCWQNIWRKGIFVHWRWECKLVQPLWKTLWRFCKNIKNRTTLLFRNFTSGYLPEESKTPI